MLSILSLAFPSLFAGPIGLLLAAVFSEKLLAYVSIGLVSSIKFLLAVIVAMGTPGFGFWDIMISAGGGALLGAVVFAYFGAQIRNWLCSRFKIGKPVSYARRRRIYGIWKRYGLPGVAFLAPIISPMVSIGIAISFQEKPNKILAYMAVSILGWTTLLAFFKELVMQWVQ
ncbi:MAG: hypothetical protein OHK0039_41800 [Bacteroidia bacterium]